MANKNPQENDSLVKKLKISHYMISNYTGKKIPVYETCPYAFGPGYNTTRSYINQPSTTGIDSHSIKRPKSGVRYF